MSTSLFRHSSFHSLISGMLGLILMCTPLAMALTPQPVQAQAGGDPVADWVVRVKTGVSAVANSIAASALKSLGLKEWVLDGVAFALAKRVALQLTRSTAAWINSGFKGSPMYITNPNQFFRNIADEIAGEVIYGSDLKFLCSPINIRVALEFYYKAARQHQPPQCTLSGVVANVQQFINGNFMAGGWPGWLSVVLTPTNQPLGGLFAGQALLEARTAEGVAIQRMKLDWGKGFLSKEVCTDPKDKKTCKTVTPGSVISEALNFNLSIGQRTLIEADEINEVISALFAQLGQQALVGVQGLFGLSQPGGGNFGGGYYSTSTLCASLSYLDQMADPTCNPDSSIIIGTSTASTSEGFVAEAILNERAYQRIHQSVINSATSTVQEATEKGQSCSANAEVIRDASLIHNTSRDRIVESEVTIQKLFAIQDKYDTGNGQAQAAAVEEYVALEGSGTLHTDVTNITEQVEVDETLAEIATIRSRIVECPREGGTRSEDNEQR